MDIARSLKACLFNLLLVSTQRSVSRMEFPQEFPFPPAIKRFSLIKVKNSVTSCHETRCDWLADAGM